MLGEFLYNLTPRDLAGLLLETRDFVLQSTVPAGSQHVVLGSANPPIIPQGRIGIPIGAGIMLQGANNPGVDVAGVAFYVRPTASNRSGFIAGFGGRSAITAADLASAQVHTRNIPVQPNMVISDLDLWQIEVCCGGPVAVANAINVTAYLRVLIMPRGDIGV